MELLSDVKKYVERVYRDLQEYTQAYNTTTQEQRLKVFEEAKAAFKKDPESVDVETVARDTLFMGSFQQTDIRRLQQKLIIAYNIYRELGGDEKFEDDIEKAVQFLKASLPKAIFVAKNGKLEEVEKGTVERLQKDYEDRDLFRMFKPTLMQLLSE